jgi:glucoamylase
MSTQVTHAGAQAPGQLHYSLVRVAGAKSDLTATAQYMFWLMFRNVASDGLVFESPPDPGTQPSPPVRSLPGCILA